MTLFLYREKPSEKHRDGKQVSSLRARLLPLSQPLCNPPKGVALMPYLFLFVTVFLLLTIGLSRGRLPRGVTVLCTVAACWAAALFLHFILK